MVDETFEQALYYFFMNNTVVLGAVVFITVVVSLISFMFVIKKWGAL